MKPKSLKLDINEVKLLSNINFIKETGVTLPLYAQMQQPRLISSEIINQMKRVERNSTNPINLYKINWYNATTDSKEDTISDLPNYLEIPPELTGVRARIIALVGKHFPTGSHKIGSSYSCLIPKIVTGQFSLVDDYAVWPSTGNFCRGGVYNTAILNGRSISILPEKMSEERFEWLRQMDGEIITTPGSESNVKEIYDEIKKIQKKRENIVVFDQFSDFFNYLWHYNTTGYAMNDIATHVAKQGERIAGVCLSSGSSGTLGSADFIKKKFPLVKLVVSEALEAVFIKTRNGLKSTFVDFHRTTIKPVKSTVCNSMNAASYNAPHC